MLVRSSRPRALLRPGQSKLFGFGMLSLAALLMTACAGSSAPSGSPRPAVKPKPVATAVAVVLADYAQFVQPVLVMSTAEGRALLSKMKHESLATLGNDCTNFGSQFFGAQQAVHGTYTPHKALPIYYRANQGFKAMLSATDECGLATDAGNKKLLKTARADLGWGVWMVGQAYSLTKAWR